MTLPHRRRRAPPRDLARRAAGLERDGVTRADLEALAADGLLAVYGPPELGGAGAAVQREVAELLAGASPDAWFVWFQHGPVVRMLSRRQERGPAGAAPRGAVPRRAARRRRLEPPAHPAAERVRHPGRRRLVASPARQPWCTGWGLTDVVLVGALCRETDEVVFGLVPAGDRPALRSDGALDLAAMGGTSTHARRASTGCVLPDDDVVLRGRPRAVGRARRGRQHQRAALDVRHRAGRPRPAARREPDAADALRRAGARRCATRPTRLLDEVDPGEQREERLELRAQALLLAIECCTALLAARGGQGMDLGEPAQRLLRAAAFQLVHSQAAHIRAATLQALAGWRSGQLQQRERQARSTLPLRLRGSSSAPAAAAVPRGRRAPARPLA